MQVKCVNITKSSQKNRPLAVKGRFCFISVALLVNYYLSAVYKYTGKGNKAGLIFSENKVVCALGIKPCVLRTLGTVVFNKHIIVNESVRAEFCVFRLENINRLFGASDMQIVSDGNIISGT